jgi:curved DNA-binding protein CbpA
MGNTPSNDGNSADQDNELYKQYIAQQQQIIMTQQRQIIEQQRERINEQNEKLQQKSAQTGEIPSNIYFQQQQNQREERVKKLQEKSKLNPYKILGVDKNNLNETALKKAYLVKAMKHHPDKGGNPEEFQKISISYQFLLKKISESKQSHEHNELREQSQQFSSEQVRQNSRNINMKDNFNSELFNKIYEENKIPEVYDEGYESWMKKQDNVVDTSKIFQGSVNNDVFTNEFEKIKREQSKRNSTQLQISEPIENISYKGRDSIMTLGQDKIKDFSGESAGGLSYRDYKDAYTNSCLIHVESVDISGRSKSINDTKSQRSNVSYQMNDKELQMYKQKQLEEELKEKERINRLQQFEQRSFNAYDKIHQRMIG